MTPDPLAAFLAWVIPAAIVFVVAAAVVGLLIWALHRVANGPAARASADAARARAGAGLVRLDDAIGELDLEASLSGALYGGEAAAALRHDHLSAQHARDHLFDRYRDLQEAALPPRAFARAAERIARAAEAAQRAAEAARGRHETWMRANLTAVDQVAAARGRLHELRAGIGDPAALVAELSARFDEPEWADASRAATSALARIDDAERLLGDAETLANDPTRSALPTLRDAERALRDASQAAGALEAAHRRTLEAAAAVDGQLSGARQAIRQALMIADGLEAADADVLRAAITDADGELARIEPRAHRNPSRAVDEIARVQSRLDLALGSSRSAQRRRDDARAALKGTLVSADAAIARAQASVMTGPTGADARVRLMSASQELTQARQNADPVEALDGARRAIRDAQDAQALADYDRLTGG